MRYTQPQSGPIRIDRSNPVSKGLVHAWSLNVAGDRAIYDAAQGVVNGAFGVGSPAPTGNYWRAGQDGYYIYFDDANTGTGNSRTITLGDANGSGFAQTPAFSFHTRARFSATASDVTLFGNESSGTFNLRLNASNQFTILPSGVGLLQTSTAAFTPNIDIDVGYSYDGAVGTFYINGKRDSSATLNRTFAIAGQVNFGAACQNGSRVYRTHVWNRALNDADFAAITANPWQIFADDDTDWLKSGGVTIPSAALAWLEQNDVTAISATYTAPLTASLAWTEANDTTAISATVTNASQLAWTEQSDTTAISATVTNASSLAWTEQNDVTSIAANVNSGGAVLNWTEQNDVAAISATVTNAGSLAWTEANDVTAITATAITPATGVISWTEQNDVCAIIAAAVVSGGLAWTEQNDVTAITAGTAQLVAAILAWVEQNDLAGYSSTGRAPLTPQILNQPFNNSLFLDGILNDRNTLRSGLDTVLPDQTVVNTMIVDKPIGLANQALLAIIPQV